MSIKKELRKYYAAQGLTGKHLRKALQHDLKAARAEPPIYKPAYYSPEVCKLRGSKLVSAFDWQTSKLGAAYWLNRSCGNGI